MADALSNKEILNLSSTTELATELENIEIKIHIPTPNTETLYAMTFQPELLEKIRRCQEEVMNQDMYSVTEEEICS